MKKLSNDVLRERCANWMNCAKTQLSLGHDKQYKAFIESYLEDKAELNRREEERENKELMGAAQAVIEHISPVMQCTRFDGSTYEVFKPTNYRIPLYR